MGNCFRKPKISYREIGPCENLAGSPVVRLYGPASCPRTSAVRIALLYKNVDAEFVPLETPNFGPEAVAVLLCGKETLSGPAEKLVRYVDGRFPGPSLLPSATASRESAMAAAARLQHRSMASHLDQLTRWAEELARRPKARPRMEVRNLGQTYSRLLEVMMEHAQMEEKIVFPVLDRADRGICTSANEEHARDFPIMNGIREDIKSIVALDSGSSSYYEAMTKLAAKLRTLQEHYREHFEEEEGELLPLLETAGMSREQQERALGQCMEAVMEVSHSRLFHFLISALLPAEAMQYLDLVCRCCSRGRAGTMIRSLMEESGQGAAPEYDQSLVVVSDCY
ncbi:hypothetical protein H6P81_003568 [Aristolochia fimbriata]|uniref:Hemerythrin-like domain-containing protein n=1 Tax=Aristolochia fimbriata TaxID=158543 RepID=A0AAV7FCZ2_ARIFI|nr:hypothetical protein H6P81_003568 [Aristolochia fimbriata]